MKISDIIIDQRTISQYANKSKKIEGIKLVVGRLSSYNVAEKEIKFSISSIDKLKPVHLFFTLKFDKSNKVTKIKDYYFDAYNLKLGDSLNKCTIVVLANWEQTTFHNAETKIIKPTQIIYSNNKKAII